MSDQSQWPDARLDALARQVESLVPLSVSIATLSANVAALTRQLEETDKTQRERLTAIERDFKPLKPIPARVQTLEADVEQLMPGPRERRDRKYALAVVVVGALTGVVTSLLTGLVHFS